MGDKNGSDSDLIPGEFLPAGLGAPVKVVERRVEKRGRLMMKLQAALLCGLDTTEFEIVCIEISGEGMSFRSMISFKVGEKLAVRMPMGNRPGRLVRCEVCHCRGVGMGLSVVGVRFGEVVSMVDARMAIPEGWVVRGGM